MRLSDTPPRGLRAVAELMVPRGPGRYALARHAALLLLADLAILLAVETTLTSTAPASSHTREALLMALGLAVAAWEYRQLQAFTGRLFRGLASELRGRVLDKLDGLDLLAFERLGADPVHSRLAQETAQLAEGGVVVSSATRYGIRAVAAMLYALWIAPQMALVIALGLGLVGLFRAASGETLDKGLAQVMRARDRLEGTMRAIVRGFTQVRLHAPRGDALMEEVSARAVEMGGHTKTTLVSMQRLDGVAQALLYGLVAVVGVGVGALNPALGAQLLITVFFVLRATNQLTMRLPQLQELAAALDAMRDLMRQIDEALSKLPKIAEAPPIERFERIALRGLRFRYDEGAFEFGPVDMEVRRGRVLFITGHNGSGKSTCLKLLLGLYPPADGAVTLDGEALPSRPAQAWRDLFSVVLSDFVLFERLLGMEQTADDARALELLSYVGLEEKVRIEGGRFSTVDLSTGQRKRLALVIAMLQDRPVFVFDEWAADQDPFFRDAFYTRILPDLKRRGKTVICVTHDDAFFHLADDEVVFSNGRVTA